VATAPRIQKIIARTIIIIINASNPDDTLSKPLGLGWFLIPTRAPKAPPIPRTELAKFIALLEDILLYCKLRLELK
jgi:hypothetical protein